MFPFFRFTKDLLVARTQPPLGLLDTHVSHHICWPWDVDMFLELNNGRTLTLYDLGFQDVEVLAGGWNAWLEAGYPVESQ